MLTLPLAAAFLHMHIVLVHARLVCDADLVQVASTRVRTIGASTNIQESPLRSRKTPSYTFLLSEKIDIETVRVPLTSKTETIKSVTLLVVKSSKITVPFSTGRIDVL